MKTWKKTLSIVAHNVPQFFFSIANRPKSHFLFHKNVSLRDFYICNDFGFNSDQHIIHIFIVSGRKYSISSQEKNLLAKYECMISIV